MSLWCPVCRQEFPDERAVCTECLAQLVADPDATVTCRHCGTVCPAHRHSCPNCMAELTVDPERAADGVAALLVAGYHLPRPAEIAPFASGPECTLLRKAARSSLIYTGPAGFMEASIDGPDHRAIPPLRCVDLDGTLLFRLDRYEAAPDAVVATDRQGAALGTYLRTTLGKTSEDDTSNRGLHVRDETSAPVGTLRPSRRGGSGFRLVETGGGILATCQRDDTDLDGWVDDQWTLRLKAELPLKTLAGVALLLAAKVLLGRPSPMPTVDLSGDVQTDDDEDRDPILRGWPYRI